MSYDPKLKEALAEIRAICTKHDIAGYIALISQTHGEFGLEVTPSWSCAKWEDKSEGVLRMRIKESEVGKEKADTLAENTAHMIYQLRDLTALGFSYAAKLAELFGKQVGVEHVSFRHFTPHREN